MPVSSTSQDFKSWILPEITISWKLLGSIWMLFGNWMQQWLFLWLDFSFNCSAAVFNQMHFKTDEGWVLLYRLMINTNEKLYRHPSNSLEYVESIRALIVLSFKICCCLVLMVINQFSYNWWPCSVSPPFLKGISVRTIIHTLNCRFKHYIKKRIISYKHQPRYHWSYGLAFQWWTHSPQHLFNSFYAKGTEW